MKALMLASVASMIDQFNMDNLALLKELGYDIDVVCNFETGNTSSRERVEAFQKELVEMGVRPISMPIPRKITAWKEIIQSYQAVKKLVQDEEYDLVHCHSPIGGVITRLACRKQRKKGTRVIYTAHGFHFYKGAPKANWMIFYPIEKYLARDTDVLITICQEDYQRGKQSMHAGQVVYSPGVGISVEQIRDMKENPELRREIGVGEDALILYSIGELNRNKNHRVIIEALARLKRKDVHFVVCGQGDQKEALEQLAKELGVESQVHLLGFRTDAKAWLKTADVFVFPSHREGLPVSLMEAMAAGLPVVASKIRGNVDLIQEEKGGYLVESTDVEVFTDRISRLLEQDQLRENFGQWNQQAVEAFGVERVREVMRRVYAEPQE